MNGLKITFHFILSEEVFMHGRKMREIRDSRYAGLIFLAFVSNILINRQCCEIN